MLEATQPDESLTACARLATVIAARVHPLLRVLLGSRDADGPLAAFARTIDAERRVGSSFWAGRWHAAGWLREERDPERAADTLWVLNANESRWLLQDRGWTGEEITDWLTQTLCAALLR